MEAKCDWLAITEQGQGSGSSTMGFNPYFHDADLVEREMRANSQAMSVAAEVDAGVLLWCRNPLSGALRSDCSGPSRRGVSPGHCSRWSRP